MSAANKIKDVLERYGEAYDERQGGTVWKVQGTPVISHKCLERVAAKAGIVWDAPVIVRAERDEAVILVTGTLGKRREWSLGEALVNVNYRVSGKQAGYVYAMAEKRSKDRVILKLVELHGLAYSEDEADDFKQPQSAPAAPPADLRNVHDLHTNGKPIVRNASQETAGKMLTKLWTICGDAVGVWLQRDDVKRALAGLDEVDRNRVEDLAEERSMVRGEEAAAQ